MRKVSRVLLFGALVGGILLAGWAVDGWGAIDQRGSTLEQLGTKLNGLWPGVYGVVGLALLGYLLSFLGNERSRPLVSMIAGFSGVGMALGVMGRGALSLFEFTRAEVPSADTLFWLCFLGGGIIAPALVAGFEAVNRALWWSLAQRLDAQGLAAPALAANRISLLFDPGHVGTLRSVALARFRKGERGSVVETLQGFYDQGQRDNDIVQALAKNSRETGQGDQLLRHLRELCDLNPGDREIREILLAQQVEQGMWRDALALMEDLGVGDDPDSLEQYGTLLVNEGHLEKASAVARRLGESEGIPFRLSQKLLREVLSRAPENLAALNTLAQQAERMALKDQRLRWLEKSYAADSRQDEIRRALTNLYRDTGETEKLERLLSDHIQNHPKDEDALIEYALILHKNERSDEAIARLQVLTVRANPHSGAALLMARILADSGEFQKAMDAVKACLNQEPTPAIRAEAEALLGRIEKGMLSTEVATALEVANREPDNQTAQLVALTKLLESGVTDKVIPLVDQIMSRHSGARDQVIEALSRAALRPDVPFPVLNLLADLLVSRNRFDEALDVVRTMADRSIDKVGAMRDGAQKILRRSPHHLATLRSLGDRYLAYGRFTDMIHSYTLYLSHGGEETEQIDSALARAYLNLGDYDNAKRFVTQLLAQRPDDAALLQQVIPLALDSNHAEDAAEFLKKLELIAPRDQETRKLKERVNAGLGERRMAYLKRELEAGRADSLLLEQLGDVARSIGNFNDGITYYQRASRDRNNAALAKRCLVKLALCYTHKRLDDLASDTLRDLTISLDDNPEELAVLMDVLYEIGDLFLDMKLYAKAERVFKQLCKIDAGYRDVLAKVESLRA